MPVQTRRELLVAIDGLVLIQRNPRREFHQRGYAEFFGRDFPIPDSAKAVLVEFIRYFCFDGGSADASFNGFQDPWVVLVTLCSNALHRVKLRDGFNGALKELVRDGAARWADFEGLLSGFLVERS